MPEDKTPRKTPTWVGKVVDSKDAEIEAEKEKTAYMREMASEQREWMERQIAREKEFQEEQLKASFLEREERSKTLYNISEADRKSKDTTIHRLWYIIILLIVAVLVLAGKTVGLSVPGMGSLSASDTPSTKSKKAKRAKKKSGHTAPRKSPGR